MALRNACSDALVDQGVPDAVRLIELRLLAQQLKYQIMELQKKIRALEDELASRLG